MTPWVPVPLSLALDVRLRASSLAARGLVLELALRGGSVPVCGDAVGTARALGDATGEALAELLALGVVVEFDGVLALGVEWPVLASPTPTVATGETPRGGISPSTLRSARRRFRQRSGQWSSVPAEVTWEEWIASDAGREWSTATPVATATQRSATPTATPTATPLQRHCNALQRPLPHTPSPRDITIKTTTTETRTPSERARGTVLQRQRNANATPVATGVATPTQRLLQRPSESVATPRCGTVESLGVDPESALHALRSRAGKAANFAHDLRSLSAWGEVVRGVDGVTVEACGVLGDWIAAGAFSWRQYGRPTLAYVLAPGRLAELLAEASAWHFSGRPAIARTPAPSARRAGPAPVSTRPDDPGAPDPLAALLVDHTGS